MAMIRGFHPRDAGPIPTTDFLQFFGIIAEVNLNRGALQRLARKCRVRLVGKDRRLSISRHEFKSRTRYTSARGVIGSRMGLKIPRPMVVWVRIPPGAVAQKSDNLLVGWRVRRSRKPTLKNTGLAQMSMWSNGYDFSLPRRRYGFDSRYRLLGLAVTLLIMATSPS